MQTDTAYILNKRKFSSFTTQKELPIDIYWLRTTGKANNSFQSLRMHHHTFFELHYCFEGALTYETPNGVFEIAEGQGLLISPHMRHMVRSSEEFCKISLAFSVEEDTPLYSALVKKSDCVFDITEETDETLTFAIAESERNTVYSNALIHARLLELICRMAELPRSRTERTQTDEKHDERIFKAKCYIDDNVDVFLTCADVAAYCHISEKQLKRLFEKHESCSLLAYIHQKKREEAERLVSESSLPFSDISDMLGFSSAAYFHRFFTEHTGMTPGDYRRTNGG